MESTLIAVDTAKLVFEVAEAGGSGKVSLRAGQLQRADKPLNALQQWALALKARSNHNKATCALANKIARIACQSLLNVEMRLP